MDALDRTAIAYLTLPLAIFLAGWFEIWAAIPLLACLAYALQGLAARAPPGAARLPITQLQLVVAVGVGCAWTVCGGTGHVVYANLDWHIRDAVLHDLVIGGWPVGYGVHDGQETLLRAPLGYYLPAALLGKCAGLLAAHVAMAAWTALGATLFLLQVLSKTPSRAGAALTAAAVIVLFSGWDIVGNLLHVPHFIADWSITRHLEWWTDRYQYSAMTTQLFWVPNHALAGWLTIGLLLRTERGAALESVLPIVVAAVALWSPFAALGVVPFVLWHLFAASAGEHWRRILDPRVWAPALVVGIAVAAFLMLDADRIPKGWTVGNHGGGAAAIATDLARQVEFFLLEAGLIGFAILAARRSLPAGLAGPLILALAVLAFLPLGSIGAWNDLAMRASIPSLTVMAIGAALALSADASDAAAWRKKAVLASLLAVGAVTPIQEFARAFALPSWPINRQATLIEVWCDRYPAHYVARLKDQAALRILRPPHPLPPVPRQGQPCSGLRT
jgi:hypothetical protein